MPNNPFCDQVVIVTGASAGIGRALALQLAQQGAKVSIAARRVERLEEVAFDSRARGGEVLVLPTDVAVEAQCEALVGKTVAAFGRLDMLINNAGLAASALFGEFPDLSLFRHTVDVNFYGAVYCTYYALPYLIESKGRIVAISSLGGKATIPYNTSYCANKFAMHGFYDALRMELVRQGVSVTIICPWWVATEFHAAQLTKDGIPRGESRGKDYYTSKTMTAARCAEITLRAAAKRRREVLICPGALAAWTKLIAPGFLDWLAVKVFLEPAARRARAAQAKRNLYRAVFMLELNLLESVIRLLCGLLASATLGAVFYGIWRGIQRQAGRTTGQMGRYLRSPWFYLVTSAIFFSIGYLGWIPFPLVIPKQARAWALLLGVLLYFPGMGLALWGRLALGRNYFVSTGFGAQLFVNQQLVTSGPFTIVRHPMYAGLILAAFGSLLIYHTWTTVMFACFAPALLNRARHEEVTLAAEFGDLWQTYCKHVPMWFPRISWRKNHDQ